MYESLYEEPPSKFTSEAILKVFNQLLVTHIVPYAAIFSTIAVVLLSVEGKLLRCRSNGHKKGRRLDERSPQATSRTKTGHIWDIFWRSFLLTNILITTYHLSYKYFSYCGPNSAVNKAEGDELTPDSDITDQQDNSLDKNGMMMRDALIAHLMKNLKESESSLFMKTEFNYKIVSMCDKDTTSNGDTASKDKSKDASSKPTKVVSKEDEEATRRKFTRRQRAWFEGGLHIAAMKRESTLQSRESEACEMLLKEQTDARRAAQLADLQMPMKPYAVFMCVILFVSLCCFVTSAGQLAQVNDSSSLDDKDEEEEEEEDEVTQVDSRSNSLSTAFELLKSITLAPIAGRFYIYSLLVLHTLSSKVLSFDSHKQIVVKLLAYFKRSAKKVCLWMC